LFALLRSVPLQAELGGFQEAAFDDNVELLVRPLKPERRQLVFNR
jgi:hypothetical protein